MRAEERSKPADLFMETALAGWESDILRPSGRRGRPLAGEQGCAWEVRVGGLPRGPPRRQDLSVSWPFSLFPPREGAQAGRVMKESLLCFS